MYIVGNVSDPLKGYNLHFVFGILASGGSEYLITIPLYVFRSSVSFPDFSKFGAVGS